MVTPTERDSHSSPFSAQSASASSTAREITDACASAEGRGGGVVRRDRTS